MNPNWHPQTDETMVALAGALEMASIGWSVIPLCQPEHIGRHPPEHGGACNRPGKFPVVKWKHRQQTAATEAEIRTAWARNPLYNVGVVTGLVSGIVMVDIDDEEGDRVWRRAWGGDRYPSWEFGTGRGGRHIVYRWPFADAPTHSPFHDLQGVIDFLGEGHMSVAPPSMHKSGLRYGWTVGGPASDMPLADVPQHLAEAALAPLYADRGPRGGAGQEPSWDDRPISERIPARALAWCRRFEASVAGSGGHAVAFKLACSLVHGFGMSDDDAYWLMKSEWNARCSPPWTDAELRHKVEQARKQGSFKRIEERPMEAPAPAPAAPPPAPPAPPPARKPAFVRGSALKPKESEFFLNPWITKGVLTLLAGQPGAGKSTFLAYLTSLTQRSIYLVGEEDPESAEFMARFAAHGVDMGRLDIYRPGRDFRLPEAAAALEEHVRTEGIGLVIADPIAAFFDRGMKADSNDDVEAVLYKLADIAHKTNVPFVCIRHPGKAKGNLLRGAAAWLDIPRTVVELLKDDGPPPSRIIRHHKNNAKGGIAPPHYIAGELTPSGVPVLKGFEPVNDPHAGEDDDGPDGLEKMRVAEAMEFLRGVLANGPVESTQVFNQGGEERLMPSTLRRAAGKLGVIKRREGVGKEHRSLWSLPCDGGSTPATGGV